MKGAKTVLNEPLQAGRLTSVPWDRADADSTAGVTVMFDGFSAATFYSDALKFAGSTAQEEAQKFIDAWKERLTNEAQPKGTK